MEKTLRLHAYTGAPTSDVPQTSPAEDQNSALELAKKTAQLEEEKNKSLDLLKTIVQLRESLKQEQAKSAELEIRMNKLASAEGNQLTQISAQLEAEKKTSLEQLKMIEQLRASLQQEQAKHAEMEKQAAAMQAQIKDLSVSLHRIAIIAAAGKLEGNA